MACYIHLLSSSKRLDPAQPHNLGDRIALIRNSACRFTAQAVHVTVAFIASIIFRTLQAVVSIGLSALKGTAYVLSGIPSFLFTSLSARDGPEPTKFEKIEIEIHKFIERILTNTLTFKEKLDLQAKLREEVPNGKPGELEELVDKILAPERVKFSTLALDPGNATPTPMEIENGRKFDSSLKIAKENLSSLIVKAKKAFRAEKKALQTPKEALESLQKSELMQFKLVASHARLFSENQLENSVENTEEKEYLEQRALQIRRQLGDLDADGSLWDSCAELTQLENAQQIKEQLSKELEGYAKGDQLYSHLKVEYYTILIQRLNLSADWLRFNAFRNSINDLNRSLIGVAEHVHTTLTRRAANSGVTLSLACPKKDANADEIEEFFGNAKAALLELHSKELDHLDQDASFDFIRSPNWGRMRDMCARVTPILDTKDRKMLLEVQTPEQRRETRTTLQMASLFMACLRQTPDGQHLVRLLDPKVASHEEAHLDTISRQAFDRLFEKAKEVLGSKIHSTLELAVSIEGDQPIQAIQPAKSAWRELSLPALSKELDLDLRFWHSELQAAWLEYLPLSDRDQLLQLCSQSRVNKMKKLFASWMLKKTGFAFNRTLNFAHLSISPRSKKEIQALETVRRRFFESGFHQKFASQPQNPLKPGFLGTYLQSIELPAPSTANLSVEFTSPETTGGPLRELAEETSILAQFQLEEPYNPEASVNEKQSWIINACDNPIYKRYDRGDHVIFAAFFHLMSELKGQSVSTVLTEEFLSLVERSELAPLSADNTWRSQVLKCYLEQIFSMRPASYQVTEQEYKYLKQMANLADFTELPKLEVVDERVGPDAGVERLGKLLQETAIGLEGVEEQTVQLSFQSSTLADSVDTRSYIDALRARSGASLPKQLLKYVQEAFPIEHDEGQEALERAITYAYRNNLDDLNAYQEELLNSYPLPENGWIREDISSEIPPSIFVRDFIIKNEPDHSAKADVIAFNRALIESQKAAQMLLGFAREIERLSKEFRQNSTLDVFKHLLKAKIGYQSVKKQAFDGKVKLEGFLKLAVDRAEMEIARSSHAVASIAVDNNSNEVVTEIYQSINQDPDARTFEEKAIYRIFRRQQEQGLDVHVKSPSFYQFGQSDLDLVTGILYHNGEQHCELPGLLRNHPNVRLLGIHEYPYVLNPDNSYSYYTTEGHRRVAQVRIAQLPNGEVSIQRRLNTSFKEAESFKHLHFVPLTSISQIPRALEQLGAKEYWTDANGWLYGYTEKGNLAFKLDYQNLASVETQSGTFILPNSLQFEDQNPKSSVELLLEHLQKIIPQDEVLVSKNQTVVVIPSIGLTLTLKEGVWHWKSPKISGMVLDLTEPELNQTFVLKWDGAGSKKARYELENQLIMLKKHLQEAREKVGHSLSERARISSMEKQIVKTTQALSNLDRRLYLTLLPEVQQREQLKDDLVQHFEMLTELAHDLSQDISPENSRALQKDYIQVEANYKRTKATYESCNSNRETVAYETSYPQCVKGQDLSASLFLLSQELNRESEIECEAWVKELSNHVAKAPYEQKVLKLIYEMVAQADTPKLLSLHLGLLLCNHSSAKIEEAKRSLQPDQEKVLTELNEEYDKLVEFCEPKYRELEAEGTNIPSASKTLMYLHAGSSGIVGQLDEAADIKFVPVAEKELKALSSESLLRRLHLASAVHCTPKNAVKEIPTAQRQLIKAFKGSGSGAQAAGFYAEAFGMFSLKAFGDELSVNGAPLYGLGKDAFEFLFKEFERLGWIHQRNSQDMYYSLSSGLGHHPLDCVQKDQIMALLASLPVTPPQQEEIARRIETFFFQVAHASFAFSWKDVAGEAWFQRAITKEAERLEAEMLDAKAFLDSYLLEQRMSMTELKRSVLIGQELARPEGREALIKYALYKTELDHLRNVHKAPQQGERSQIELLSMQRQYSVDLLLRAPKNPKERELQTINLAFLLFEESSACRCNPMQVRIFSSLVQDSENPESIDAMQARMGFGKTWLLSLLAIVKHAREGLLSPEEKSLICYVVPPAVLQDNAASFNARLEDVLGSCVIQDTPFNRYQIDPNNVTRSFEWMLIDLEKRLAFYENARNSGISIIQPPETRLAMEAQEKALGFMATNGSLQPDEQVLCLKAKQLLGRIRSIKGFRVFDELDATQDFRACEVNFTEGKSFPIESASIIPLEMIVQSVEKIRSSNIREIADHVLRDLDITDPRGLFATYVTSADKKVSDIDGLKEALDQLGRPAYLSIFLLRAALLDPNILDFMTNKQPHTHFGVRFGLKGSCRTYSYDQETDSALLIAVPYEGTNNPKGLSTYDCAEVAAITTLRYYASRETLLEEVHLDFLMRQVEKNAIPSCIEEHVKGVRGPRGKSFLERLRHLTGLVDAAEVEQAKTAFMRDFMDSPKPEVRAFLGRSVVATQVRTDEARANSNRYEMGSPQDQLRGCSGTVSSTSAYFEKPFEDPKADGMLSIAIMGRENNSEVHRLPAVSDSCTDYLDFILKAMLEGAKDSTRAIIDVAGICKSPDGLPETIVLKLWELLQEHDDIQGIEGIIFYDKGNMKSLYRGPAYPIIKCTTDLELAALRDKKYFTFYGQKNTRGSDVKQAQGAHALVTMDQNAPNADAKQGVLRFRDLVQESSGQTFTFVITDKYAQLLQENAAIRLSARSSQAVDPDSVKIDAKTIVSDLRLRELRQQHLDALVLFRSELKAHVEQAAAHMERQVFADVDLEDPKNARIYAEFLQARDQLSPLVDRSVFEIENKYGGAVEDQARDEFIQQECRKCLRKIKALEEISTQAAEDLFIDTPDLDIEFFNKRVEASKALFESRYPADTRVQVSTIDSAAEAVAQALAQAQAQALVESVAETISQAIVTVQDRLPNRRLEMAKEPHFETPDDWFKAPDGRAASELPYFKHLLHKDVVDRVLISPHLDAKKIVSHFALVPKYNKSYRSYIFLSQQEADRWLTEFETPYNQYTCVDLREYDAAGDVVLQNMKEAAMQPTTPVPEVRTTEDLRQLSLPNITPQQLVPSLQINATDPEFIQRCFDLTSFGVIYSSKEPIQMSFKRQAEKFEIQAEGIKVELPLKNKWLEPIFSAADSYGVDKFRQIKQEFLKQSAAIRHRLEELKLKQARLAQIQEKLKATVTNASAFTLSYQLEEGLRHRDKEFLRDANRSFEDERVKTCGAAFIDKVREIQAAQKRCQREGSLEAFQALSQEFNEFISEKMQKSTVLTTAPAFSNTDWISYKRAMPPFDQAYGRILYSVHCGSFDGAKCCGRLDCNNLFNYALPAIQETVANLQKATVEVTSVTRKIKDTEAEIIALRLQMQDLDEADKCIKSMEDGASNIIEAVTNKGMRLVENDPNLLWDRVQFAELYKAKEADVYANINTQFPQYHATYMASAQEHKRRIHSLSLPEQDNMNAHERLDRDVASFSLRVEKRQEVTWS